MAIEGEEFEWDNKYGQINPYAARANSMMRNATGGGDPNSQLLSDIMYQRLLAGQGGGGAAEGGPTGPSKTGFGIAGGANVVGSTVGAIQAQRALNQRRKRGVLDLRPDELKSMLGEYALKANSTQLPNYNRAVSNINATQAQATGDAALAATSPDQLQAMIAKNARVAGGQKMQLDQAGVELQRQNKAIQRQLMGQSGQYRDRARQEYNTDISSLRNAVWSNINNAVNSAAQTALMIA
jgi:hypothetical protein